MAATAWDTARMLYSIERRTHVVCDRRNPHMSSAGIEAAKRSKWHLVLLAREGFHDIFGIGWCGSKAGTVESSRFGMTYC